MYPPTERASTSFGDAARPPVAAVGAIVVAVVYLWWRSSTLGTGALLLLSVPLVIIEGWSFVELALLTIQTWRLPPSHPRPDAGLSHEEVDIAVVAAEAGVEELERTLAACRAVRSRGRLVVIDDERRYRLRSLAADAGAAYHIDRRAIEAPGLAAHRNTTSDRYVWLQAGQLPTPDLIEVTASRFDRDEVAICQLATTVLNSDDLAHLGRERDDDGLVNQVLGPALSRWDAGLWLGSASVVRRRAIDDIGGFDREVPIERLVARLHRAGWATSFERRRLVASTAPEGIDHYLAVRRQRAGAAISVLLSTDGPLAPGGSMSPWQRLAHLGAVVRFGAGVRLMALAIVAIAVLLTGVFPADGDAVPLLTMAALAAAAGAIGRQAVARGSMLRGDWIHQGWRVVGAETAAVIDAVTGRVAATVDGQRWPGRTGGWRALAHLPLLDALIIALDLALVARAATMVNRSLLPAFATGQRIVVIGSTLVMLGPVFRVLQVTVDRQQRRSRYRIAVELEATLDGAPTTTTDLTPAGAGVLASFEPRVGSSSSLEISLPGDDGMVRRIVGRAVVRSARPDGAGAWRVGLQFTQLAPAARQSLITFCARQPAADELGEAALAPADAPLLDAQERRRRSVRRFTIGAGLAGLATVAFGPGAASASTADPGLVERICVVDPVGGPVTDVLVERLVGEPAQVLGVTDLIGCVDTEPRQEATGFEVVHRGARYRLEPTDYRGALAQVALVTWRVQVVDADANSIPGAQVRFFTDRWLPALAPAEPGDGHRFDGLPVDPASQQIEVRVDSARHVRAMGDAVGRTVVLSRVRLQVGTGTEPVDRPPTIDRGRGWEPLVDGAPLVPGPAVFRLADGRILRIDVPEGHDVLLPDGILVPVEVVVAEVEPAPTTTTASTPTTAPTTISVTSTSGAPATNPETPFEVPPTASLTTTTTATASTVGSDP